MNTPTTSDFINASPEQKADMVLQGIDRMRYEFENVSRNLRVLRGWISTLPALVENGDALLPESSELLQKFTHYVKSTDNLTAQIVGMSENINQLVTLYKEQSA